MNNKYLNYLFPVAVLSTSLAIYAGAMLMSNSNQGLERKTLPAQDAKIYREAYRSEGSKVYDQVRCIIVPDQSKDHSAFDRKITLQESNLVNNVQISQ